MSVNIEIRLDVTELESLDQARAVVDAATKYRDSERLSIEDLMIVVRGDETRWTVVGYSHYPVIISGFGGWSDRFTPELTAAIAAVAPDAKIEVWYEFPDDD